MESDVTSTETRSSMIVEPIVMVAVGCPRLLQGVGHTCRGHMKTDALTASKEVFQSTPGSQALMRDLFSFKVWWTGTELTEKVTTEMHLPAAEHMFRGQSALVEPSGPL